jgi:hypothetical protein
MNPMWAFVLGLALPVASSVVVLRLVHPPFTAVLRELCRGEERARFWAKLYDSSIFLTVIFVAMLFPPDRTEPADFFAVLATWRAGVFGLLASLTVLAIVMLKFIRQHDRALDGQPAR